MASVEGYLKERAEQYMQRCLPEKTCQLHFQARRSAQGSQAGYASLCMACCKKNQ